MSADEELNRQLAEQKRASAVLERFFDLSLDMLCIANFEGYFKRLNPAWEQTLGFTVEELQAHPFLYFVHPDDVAKTIEEMQKLSGGMDTISFENRYRCKDGTYKWLLWNATPLLAQQVIYADARDITERKTSEERVRELKEVAENANRSKSDFLAQMSHEIRTPMNAIIGMADLLWETPLSADQRQYVRIFRRAGSNLLNLLNDILDLSKIEAGHIEMEEIDFDLRDIIDKVCELLAVRAHEKGLELACRITPDVPSTLRGDPTRLRQILTNLLGNAIKFTSRGEVVLQVEHDPASLQPEHLRFRVADTGIGIPEEKLASVFGIFTQVDSSTTRQYGGSGLGLAIAKYFVQRMNGRIWAESKLGVGSAFYFTAQFSAARDAAPRAMPRPLDLHGLRTLIVDDNATNRLILAETLGAWHALLTTAESGDEALTELVRASQAGEPYALVLLDCRMPGMDGFQLAEHIHIHPSLAAMTVLMLTSDNRAGDMARCSTLGINACLVKPIQRPELLEAIQSAIAQSQGSFEIEPAAEYSRPSVLLPSLRVLLAEDSEDNVFLTQSYLRDSGCSIDVAENGEIAVQKFEAGSYDLVIMDVQMPVMDGYAATRQIRNWERKHNLKPVPVIALTAYASQQQVQKSRAAGCTTHLTKPVRKKTLLDLLQQYSHPLRTPTETRDVDPRLRAKLPGYLDARRGDTQRLEEALADADYEKIGALGHKMHGSGASYGLPEITSIGARLEIAAEQRNSEDIRQQIAALNQFLLGTTGDIIPESAPSFDPPNPPES